MMQRIAFLATLAFAYPLSLLPFNILYFFSDILYYLIYYVTGYRKNVVYLNLRNAFPEKSDHEIDLIAKKFYRNLCDYLVENIKMITVSREEIQKRFILINFELLNEYYKQGRNVIVTIGHCGNWEWAGLATSLRVKHHVITFYRKLKNIYFDNFVKQLRSKFGMELVSHKNVRTMLKQEGQQSNMYIFITDQTPSNSLTSYWTTFLNQDTPVFKGAEKVARMTGHPVVYGDIKKIKRGHYSIEALLLTEDPAHTKEGEITELHTHALENAIKSNPDNWLWTHRRWKRKKPTPNLKAEIRY